MRVVLLAVGFVVVASAIWWVPLVVLWDCTEIVGPTTLNDCEDANIGVGGILRGFFAIAAVIVGVLLVDRLVRVFRRNQALRG